MTVPGITSEADIIQGYFAPLAAGFAGAHGLSDDAASLNLSPGMDLVATMDAIASGVHFFPDDAPADIGWKALAVNVSDLVAKGARPHGYLMSLAFPETPSRSWLADFAQGLGEAQAAFGLSLIGGDTDKRPGPLSVTITALGLIPKDHMVRRGTAQAGDRLLVSGTLGDSALGLALRATPNRWSLSDDQRAHLASRYLRPQPPLALAPLLRKYASASMDISDGLLKDAGRMAVASGVAMSLTARSLPLSDAAVAVLAQDPGLLEIIVAGGDDYEILATFPAALVASVIADAAQVGIVLTEIGRVDAGAGVVLCDDVGQPIQIARPGFDHF